MSIFIQYPQITSTVSCMESGKIKVYYINYVNDIPTNEYFNPSIIDYNNTQRFFRNYVPIELNNPSATSFWNIPSFQQELTENDLYDVTQRIFFNPYSTNLYTFDFPPDQTWPTDTPLDYFTIIQNIPWYSDGNFKYDTEPKIEVFLYGHEIADVYSNNMTVPLLSSTFFDKKSALITKDFSTWYNTTKNRLTQTEIKSLNFYCVAINGSAIYQRDNNNCIIKEWLTSLPLKNVLLHIYEPVNMNNAYTNTIILQRDRYSLETESNPFTITVEQNIINSLRGRFAGGIKKKIKTILCSLVKLSNFLTTATNFPSANDRFVFIKFEDAQNCSIYMNKEIQDGIVCFFDLNVYQIEGQNRVNVDFLKNKQPQIEGQNRTFELSDIEDFQKIKCSFLNSKNKPLLFDNSNSALFNPTLIMNFEIIY